MQGKAGQMAALYRFPALRHLQTLQWAVHCAHAFTRGGCYYRSRHGQILARRHPEKTAEVAIEMRLIIILGVKDFAPFGPGLAQDSQRLFSTAVPAGA
jgi:hypothetical protein